MKIIKRAFIAVVIVFSILGLYQMNKTEVLYSDFSLRNIEALANEEGQNRYYCIGEGDKTCPVTGHKVRVVYTLSK